MRIEIACNGGYRVDSFVDELDNLYDRIGDTIEELENIYRGISSVNGGINGNLSDARDNIRSRVNKEKEKMDSVLKIREKTETFYDTAVRIDKQVARQVDENSEKFFAKYAGLGTITNVEKSWWNEFVEGWKGFWGDVGNAIKSAWDGLCEFFAEYAVEMIVGTIGFVVGAVILIFGAGVTLATVAVMALVALGTVVLEASIAGLIGYLQGGDFWEIFKEQFATGFMFAGIFFAVQAIFSAVVNFIKTKKAAKVIDKVDDVADKTDDALKSTKKTYYSIKDLSDEQVEALTKYTGDSHRNINNSLRGRETLSPDNKATVDALKSTLSNSSLKNDMTLYRGSSKIALGELKNLSPDDLVGKTFTEKGFMSTSKSSTVAKSTFTGDMFITIDAPKGSQALDITKISKYTHEMEILFNSGMEMLITSATEIDGILYINVMLK